MKTSVLASEFLILLLVFGYTQAADAAGAKYDWTGFYAGLNAGLAINNSGYNLQPTGSFAGEGNENNPLITDSGNFNSTAFTGGGQLGYNYQICNFVIGMETDFNYNGVNESKSVDRALDAPLSGGFIHSVNQKFDYFGTLRARVGFTPRDRWLVYGTGGLAYGHVNSNSNALFTFDGQSLDNYIGSSSNTRVGWTAGAGSEYAFYNNWSAKIEYNYIDLGSHSYTYDDSTQLFPGYTYTTNLKTRENVVRFGINTATLKP